MPTHSRAAMGSPLQVSARGAVLDLTGVFTRDFEIMAPVISPDLVTLALGMIDGRVRLRHLPAGSTRTWTAHPQQVRNLAFSP
ncbi:MAG TPA: hypothetical protein VGA56_14045, partial [Opitutaceae bacterium]